MIFNMSVLLTFQGTDETMLAKVHKTHEGNKNYLKPKSDKIPAFGLSHFAGTVFYNVKGKYYVDNSDTMLSKKQENRVKIKLLLDLSTMAERGTGV
jgi:myosin heavy subunit